MNIFITHRIISKGSHWIKQWLSDDIRGPIWYPSPDFFLTDGKPRNKQMFKLNFLSAKENQKRLFAEASDE